MAVMAGPAAAETVSLYAAGSLKGALTDVAKAFEAASGNTVQAKFGASGLLKDEIAGGAKADVFASANMGHPQALSEAKKSGPVVLFARNRLCALVKPGLEVNSASLFERMPTSHVRIDVGGQVVMAAITNEAVEDLKLAVGQTAYAVIKASDVMVGVVS